MNEQATLAVGPGSSGWFAAPLWMESALGSAAHRDAGFSLSLSVSVREFCAKFSLSSHARPLRGGDHDGNRVTGDRNQRRRRRTLGHTLLLLLRNDPGPARHFSAVFHGGIEKQRVLPMDNLELRITNVGRSNERTASSSSQP